jgi:hypothetical protein
MLVNDVILIICQYLNDNDKFLFLSTCKQYNQLKNKLILTDLYSIDYIYSTKYYNQCINIIIDETLINYRTNDIYKFPKNVKMITFDKNFDEDIESDIPNTVEYLEFYGAFKVGKYTKIPTNVNTLIFHDTFIYDNNHIGITYGFNPKNLNFIPSTVKYLSFYNPRLYLHPGFIPKGVTHLTFGKYFNQNMYNIVPLSLKQLIVPNHYRYLVCNLNCIIYYIDL